RDVVARHESLRTMYFVEDGDPVPRVLDSADAEPGFTVVEVTSATMEAEIARAGRYRFRLDHDLPFHAVLLVDRDRSDVSALLLVMHHIAVDGWSLPPLAHDLSQAYTSRLHGNDPGLRPVEDAYAAYARRQRDRLGDPAVP